MDKDNPYSVACDSEPGVYDWSLAKQAFLWFAGLAAFYLLCAAVVSFQTFRADCNHRHEPALNTVVEFFIDWRDGNGLE